MSDKTSDNSTEGSRRDADRVSDAIQGLRSGLAELAEAIFEKGLQGSGEARSHAREAAEELGRKARENPMLALAAAFGLGFLVAKLIVRDHPDRK